MLRIHFTGEDLARTRIAAGVNHPWEIVFSLHRLQADDRRAIYGQWRRRARADLARAGMTGQVRHLLNPLYPRASYFPDFLTPSTANSSGSADLETSIETVLSTPRRRLHDELQMITFTRGAPAWAAALADGDRDTLTLLGDTLRRYHHAVIAPYAHDIIAALDSERALRARIAVTGGTEAMLDSLHPTLRWQPPVLTADYPVDGDLHLHGRGIVLIPSFFCQHKPVALADRDLPPVLAYPIDHHWRTAAPSGSDPLTALLGRSRAAVLRAAADALTTTELARHTRLSAASASENLTVLREAGLVTSRRHANTVIHTLTPLGALILANVGRV
ncbi:helix-turn-helix domain-containing protein [Actinoallomurus purpureus]|uniref:ArsR/SmtB family transcription factor n=1 Tax=Actinoallomurus purpureus TaxID=478114 RepID=UPI002093A325|nr:helix-turn-helix domain-containing protein [Actinoallomurus purpureus]MCO6010819.1 helix-turn-helix domain-containing protein [Actinoallomurus purpureus]